MLASAIDLVLFTHILGCIFDRNLSNEDVNLVQSMESTQFSVSELWLPYDVITHFITIILSN